MKKGKLIMETIMKYDSLITRTVLLVIIIGLLCSFISFRSYEQGFESGSTWGYAEAKNKYEGKTYYDKDLRIGYIYNIIASKPLNCQTLHYFLLEEVNLENPESKLKAFMSSIIANEFPNSEYPKRFLVERDFRRLYLKIKLTPIS